MHFSSYHQTFFCQSSNRRAADRSKIYPYMIKSMYIDILYIYSLNSTLHIYCSTSQLMAAYRQILAGTRRSTAKVATRPLTSNLSWPARVPWSGATRSTFASLGSEGPPPSLRPPWTDPLRSYPRHPEQNRCLLWGPV